MSVLPVFSSDLLPNKNIMMPTKLPNIKFDDLNYWNVRKSFNYNEIENLYDEEQSLALSVNLLLKNSNISPSNPVRLPAHLVRTEHCQCHRSFHIFCTDLFSKNEQDIDMIYIHPAPRNHDRDLSRRVSTPWRKFHRKYHEDNEQDNVSTTRSEPNQMTISESQSLEKKSRVPPKTPSRTISLNIPATYQSLQRSSQTLLKYSASSRILKSLPPPSTAQVQIRTLSVFEQSPSTSQMFVPRGPPPSPKTPTLETPLVLPQPVSTAPLRAFSIAPRVRNPNEIEKKSIKTFSMKNPNYEDHAREYLSASDCSDNEKNKNDDDDNDDDKDQNQLLTITQPKLPARNPSLSRSGTSLRNRLMAHTANRYLSLAEVYYSSLDVHKNFSDKSQRRLRPQTRLMVSTTEDEDGLTTITRTTSTAKTAPVVSPSKSVFGFSKTASSMHFGHAAGRLGLHGSFEKWPQPLSRRTPIERKQEVTALRLVTLPLVTS